MIFLSYFFLFTVLLVLHPGAFCCLMVLFNGSCWYAKNNIKQKCKERMHKIAHYYLYAVTSMHFLNCPSNTDLPYNEDDIMPKAKLEWPNWMVVRKKYAVTEFYVCCRSRSLHAWCLACWANTPWTWTTITVIKIVCLYVCMYVI